MKFWPLKKLTWFSSLLFTTTLVAELYAFFTGFSDRLGFVQQTNVGLKLFYFTAFAAYTLELIFNKSEAILVYLLICLHCLAFDCVLMTLIGLGRLQLSEKPLLTTFMWFLVAQSGLALLSFFGSLAVYMRIKRLGRKRDGVDVLKKYAFTRFNVLSDE